ncbi:high affinity nickel transporter nic1 [Diplocarpon mali]|nr:high affinity nickel transporter nic1 [Diplocarpon mali]
MEPANDEASMTRGGRRKQWLGRVRAVHGRTPGINKLPLEVLGTIGALVVGLSSVSCTVLEVKKQGKQSEHRDCHVTVLMQWQWHPQQHSPTPSAYATHWMLTISRYLATPSPPQSTPHQSKQPTDLDPGHRPHDTALDSRWPTPNHRRHILLPGSLDVHAFAPTLSPGNKPTNETRRIVIITSIVVAATAAAVSDRFGSFGKVGGIIGTSVSAAFLIILSLLNVWILWKLVLQLKGIVERGEEYVPVRLLSA